MQRREASGRVVTWNRQWKEEKQVWKVVTWNRQWKEEKQVEELLHEISNEKKRSKWKSCYMK